MLPVGGLAIPTAVNDEQTAIACHFTVAMAVSTVVADRRRHFDGRPHTFDVNGRDWRWWERDEGDEESLEESSACSGRLCSATSVLG
jgi:hypothetical protein